MVASLDTEPNLHSSTPTVPDTTPGAARLSERGPRPMPTRPPAARPLSAAQVGAIRAAMRVFVEDDLARGADEQRRSYCDGCERARPAAGFIQYDKHALCNGCATEYEVARARGLVPTPGQYIRDKRFGDGDSYAL